MAPIDAVEVANANRDLIVGIKVRVGRNSSGTSGTVQFSYSDRDTQVIYAEGAYEGPLFDRPLTAHCVLVLKSGYVKETNGRYYVTQWIDLFTYATVDDSGAYLFVRNSESGAMRETS